MSDSLEKGCSLEGTTSPALQLVETEKRMRMEAIPSATRKSSTQQPKANQGNHSVERTSEKEDSRLEKDQITTSLIEKRLVQTLNQRAFRITCTVEQGHVKLVGTVRCFYEMQLAQEAALRTRGVQSVINLIEIEPEISR